MKYINQLDIKILQNFFFKSLIEKFGVPEKFVKKSTRVLFYDELTYDFYWDGVIISIIYDIYSRSALCVYSIITREESYGIRIELEPPIEESSLKQKISELINTIFDEIY